MHRYKMNKKSYDFIKDNMCLDMEHLEGQIKSEKYANHKSEIYKYVDCVCNLFEEGNEDIESLIEKKFKEINDDIFLPEEYSELLNCIRITFLLYAEGGIKSLYKGRQAEWPQFPRVIIRRHIDISRIENRTDPITIYRGCDKNEYSQKSYGQSWTLDRKTAKDFAYTHYKTSDSFDMNNRVVLCAEIQKEHVYWAIEIEEEMVVSTDYLLNVRISEDDY